MSLIQSTPNKDGSCNAPAIRALSTCIQCDSSFISSIPTDITAPVPTTNGGPLSTTTCTYYPTWNNTTKLNICYQNDIFVADKGCQKIFSITK